MLLSAGGVDFIDMLHTTQDLLTINSNSADIDLLINSNVGVGLFMQGSDGFIGVGTASPTYKLESVISDAGTNTAVFPLSVDHISSGSTSMGFGAGINFRGQNFTGTIIDIARVVARQYGTNIGTLSLQAIYGYDTFVDGIFIVPISASKATVQFSGNLLKRQLHFKRW
jgi:hypothetical protein